MKDLINKIKEENEDFEFYPTTKEIIQVIANDIRSNRHEFRWHKHLKLLDIGCGNGNALSLIEECVDNKINKYGEFENDSIFFKKYGIEKSNILIQNLHKDIIIIGSDFHYNTLIDKQMDFIFCNPPYTQYENWFVKIIKEANCSVLYMVVPERWKENEEITRILERRCNYKTEIGERYKSVEVIGSFDFLDSEYRKARAKVDVIKIKFMFTKETPFDIWFTEYFDIFNKKEVKFEEKANQQKDEIVEGRNLIERIVNLYENELNKLLTNYKKLEEIDNNLLQELGVNSENLKAGLKEKIHGLKNKYWKELFDNLDKITERLTTKFRERILSKMFENISIDITTDNIYNIVLWIIKNSNEYQDEQLKDIYMKMTEPENVKLYKSNIHFVADTWRYNYKNQIDNYMLDYRLVLHVGTTYSQWEYENINGISKNCHDYINDIFTIAKTLGFNLKNSGIETAIWQIGKQITFKDDDGIVFGEFRPYKNGNLHVKFNKKFILKLNLEVGKLNGWLKDPVHASEEMDIPLNDIEACFKTHNKIEFSNLKLLS